MPTKKTTPTNAEDYERKYRLNPKQFEFINSPTQYTFYVGGIGAGKSYAGAVKAIRHMLTHPKSLGVIGAPTFRMVRETTMRTLFDLLPRGAVVEWNKNEQRILLVNGAEVLFHSMDEPDRSRGLNLGWFWLDEAPLCGYYSWQILKGRLRQQGTDLKGFATGTPKGKDGYWKDFEAEPLPDHLLVRASTHENKKNLPTGYVESLGYSGAFFEQEVLGRFEAFEGLVYRFEANPLALDTHVRTPPQGTHFVRVIGGVDWGYTNPSVGLVFGIDALDRVWQIGEFYQRHITLETFIAQLVEMTQRYGVQEWYCDPAEPGHLQQFNQALDKVDSPATARRGDNSVTAGIQTVQRLLAIRGDGARGLYIAPTCAHTIAEYGAYQYETKDGVTRNADEKPVKQNDHAQDATRYALHTALGTGRGGALPLVGTRFGQFIDNRPPLELGERDEDHDDAEAQRRSVLNARFMQQIGFKPGP